MKLLSSIVRIFADAVLFMRIAFFVIALPFTLRIFPLSRILNSCLPRKIKRLSPALQSEKTTKIIATVDFLLQWHIPIFRSTCLKRSLALFKFLREIDIPLVINFGINKGRTTKEFKRGHVWLTRGGAIIFPDNAMNTYTLTYQFPEQSHAKKDNDDVL